MKHLNLKKIHCFSLLMLSILFFSSCKKLGADEEKQPFDAKTYAQNEIKKALAQNPNLANVIIPLNIKSDSKFADKRDNILQLGSINSYIYQCDDIDYPPYTELISISREYDCTSGFRFTVKWKISASFPLYAVNPNTSSISKGRFRIRNTSVTSLYYEPTITPVTFTDLGDDPATSNTNRLYSIEYTTQWIPFSYFTLDTAPLEHSFFAQTDCEDYPQITSFTTSTALVAVLDPCYRIEPIQISDAEFVSGVRVTNGLLQGYYNLIGGCSPPTGSTMPQRHEIQIKCVESGYSDSWRNITPVQGTLPGPNILTDGRLNPFNSATQAGTIGTGDSYFIPERDLYYNIPTSTYIHGDYKVKYRNITTGTCNGPWSNEYLTTF